MGYQEALIKFKNKKAMEKQWKNHVNNKNTNEDSISMLDIYSLVEVKESFRTTDGKQFRKGNCFMFIGGERSHQRNVSHVENELEISNIKGYVQIEDIADSFEKDFKCLKKFVDLDIWKDVKVTSLSSFEKLNIESDKSSSKSMVHEIER